MNSPNLSSYFQIGWERYGSAIALEVEVFVVVVHRFEVSDRPETMILPSAKASIAIQNAIDGVLIAINGVHYGVDAVKRCVNAEKRCIDGVQNGVDAKKKCIDAVKRCIDAFKNRNDAVKSLMDGAFFRDLRTSMSTGNNFSVPVRSAKVATAKK